MPDVVLKLPNLGEDAGQEATVTFWHVAAGDEVAADKDIVEVTYDKATFFVPSPCAGRVKEILAPEDATVPVGAPLAVIATNG
jgi:pyruvate/2-oxoglutarate dehydrogenase complex dihydrolipoamide acyltransferase (E2) component